MVLRGRVAISHEGSLKNDQPHGTSGLDKLVDFTVRRRRRVVRSTFGAELNGLVDSVEQVLLLQVALHEIHCGTHQTPEEMIDLFERGGLHPHLDFAVDVRAVYDVVAAAEACDPGDCSLKLHLISVRDRLAQGIIRRLHWVDTRDMLADVLTNGGVDRTLLHMASNDCQFKLGHQALTHTKIFVGSVTIDPATSGDTS